MLATDTVAWQRLPFPALPGPDPRKGVKLHKLGNVLDKLPKRLQPRVKSALHEVMYAETREQACEAVTRFATEYGPKYPKAVATLPAPEPVAGTATRSATCSSRRW